MVSRQRLFQLRHRERGLCILCAQPARLRADGMPSQMCSVHWDADSARRKSDARRAKYRDALRRRRARKRAERIESGVTAKLGAPLGQRHRCSVCGGVGHKKPTCTVTPEQL